MKYFITFRVKEHTGTGRCEVIIEGPIQGMEDIKAIEKKLTIEYAKPVAVIGFQKFDKE